MSPLDHTPKMIQLTQEQVAIVCTHDYEELSQTSWYAHWVKSSDGYYAQRNSSRAGGTRGQTVHMHRIVANTPVGMDTDHINKDTVDNRCTNLRAVNRSTNAMNRKLNNNNTSGMRGVTRQGQGWQVEQQGKYLGYFRTKEDAITFRTSL